MLAGDTEVPVVSELMLVFQRGVEPVALLLRPRRLQETELVKRYRGNGVVRAVGRAAGSCGIESQREAEARAILEVGVGQQPCE